jgi:hypothetical protein
MTAIFEVRQNGFPSYGDGQHPAMPLARMGLPAVLDKWDLFALSGRMFQVTQTTVGTALTGSAQAAGGIVLTAPTIRFDVPTGYTVFPRRLNITYEARAGVDNELVVCSATSASTTGGLALVPLNMRQDAPYQSVVRNVMSCSGAAITEGALTVVRCHWQSIDSLAFSAEDPFCTRDILWDDLRPIVGPCAFLIFQSGKTTASSAMFTLEWAEVPTSTVKAV